jgi:hypothetical protein
MEYVNVAGEPTTKGDDQEPLNVGGVGDAEPTVIVTEYTVWLYCGSHVIVYCEPFAVGRVMVHDVARLD